MTSPDAGDPAGSGGSAGRGALLGRLQYRYEPTARLMSPIRIIPPVTGIQVRRCLRENGRARSFGTTPVS